MALEGGQGRGNRVSETHPVSNASSNLWITDPMQPSASAMFSRRLMHNCSAEIDASDSMRIPVPPSQPQFSFSPHLRPKSPHTSFVQNSSSIWEELEAQRIRQQEMEDDLLDSLDELSEGIDVLQILERAYDHTIKSHVAPPAPQTTTPPAFGSSNADSGSSFMPQRTEKSPEPTPLMSGSSTALLAVLDHPPQKPSNGTSSMTTLSIVSSSACPPLSTSAPTTSSPFSNYAAGTLHPSIYLDKDEAQTCDAVIKIAHIGDCMGMLVRDEEIIWRSEEMWWEVSFWSKRAVMKTDVGRP